VLAHDRELGACRVILVELADALEELGATLVIQKLAGDGLFRSA
jgi:hypothetical protein